MCPLPTSLHKPEPTVVSFLDCRAVSTSNHRVGLACTGPRRESAGEASTDVSSTSVNSDGWRQTSTSVNVKPPPPGAHTHTLSPRLDCEQKSFSKRSGDCCRNPPQRWCAQSPLRPAGCETLRGTLFSPSPADRQIDLGAARTAPAARPRPTPLAVAAATPASAKVAFERVPASNAGLSLRPLRRRYWRPGGSVVYRG